jgi:hypothetical protein
LLKWCPWLSPKFSFSNCQNFPFQTVKIFLFKLSKFSFSNCQIFPFQTVKISLFQLSKFPFQTVKVCFEKTVTSKHAIEKRLF